jgi:hypothetical protein
MSISMASIVALRPVAYSWAHRSGLRRSHLPFCLLSKVAYRFVDTVAWTLFTPQATLFNDQGEQLISHFFSPNPFENGIVRATWEDSRGTSTV